MGIRELPKCEWPRFFDAFSRIYRTRRVTVELEDPDAPGRFLVLARGQPLQGIVVEPDGGGGDDVREIEIILCDADDHFTTHVVHSPYRIRIGQVSNGEDELLLVDSTTDPSVRVDFRPPGGRDVAVDFPSVLIDRPREP